MRNEVVEELTPDFVGASSLISASARQKPSLNREKSQRNEQQGRGEAGKPGKEATRCHSEQRACPRRGNAEAPKRHLRRRQAEPGSKACWETEQTDRHSASRWGSGIARPPLGKRETVMRPASHERGWAAMVLAVAGPAQASRPSVGGAGVACRHADALYDSNHGRRSGAEPTESGCRSRLTRRGLVVCEPCHWQCSRKGHGRQSVILAA